MVYFNNGVSVKTFRFRDQGEDVPAVGPAFHALPEVNRPADHIHDCRIRLGRPFRIFHAGYMGPPVERLAPRRMEMLDVSRVEIPTF